MSAFRIILYGLLLALVLGACSKAYVDVPKCVDKKIKQIKKEPPTNPRTEVWRWKVDGKTYYYITSDCCDQYNYLYDDKCQVVCAPDGGFSGNGDGNCPSFSGNVEEKLVWKDER